MLDFCLICVCVRAGVCMVVSMIVCAHMTLCVSKHVRGLPTNYSLFYFLSKYLLIDSIDMAKRFG